MSILSSLFKKTVAGRLMSASQTKGEKLPGAGGPLNAAGNASASLKQTDTDAGGLGGATRPSVMSSLPAFQTGSQGPGDSAEAEEARTGRRLNRGISNTIRNQRISSRFGSGFGRSAF